MTKTVMINNRHGRNAVGGAEQVVARMVAQFKREQQTVIVLSLEPFHGFRSLRVHHDTEDPEHVFRLAPLNICSYQYLGALPLVGRFFWHLIDLVNPHSFVMIAAWLARVRPNTVITHNLMGLGLLTPSAIRWWTRSQWTHVLHDIQLLHPSGLLMWGQERSRGYRGVLARSYRAITRMLMGQPNIVISPSHWLMNEHTKFGFFSSSIKNVSSPIKTNMMKSPLKPATHSSKQLLFLGQLEIHKGILFLLNAFERIEGEVHLSIVGDGALRSQIQERLKHNTRCTVEGRLEGPALEALWATTDILVVPSLCFENAPTVIVEAIERGIFVVASRCGGIPELIHDVSRGLLFEPGNIDECIRALEQMIKAENPYTPVSSDVKRV